MVGDASQTPETCAHTNVLVRERTAQSPMVGDASQTPETCALSSAGKVLLSRRQGAVKILFRIAVATLLLCSTANCSHPQAQQAMLAKIRALRIEIPTTVVYDLNSPSTRKPCFRRRPSTLSE